MYPHQLNFDSKIEKLQTLTTDKDVINRLFYSSRNLKIEELCYTVRKYFQNKGFKVNTDWRESSFGDTAAFVITFLEKRNEFEYRFVINRKRSLERLTSDLVYIARSGTGCYTRYQISANHQNFINEVQSDTFFIMIDDLVKNVNYPFNEVIDVFNPIVDNENMISNLFAISKESSRFYFLKKIEQYFNDKGLYISVQFNNNICQIILDKPYFVFDVLIEKQIIENVQKDVDNTMLKFDKFGQVMATNSKSKKIPEFLNIVLSNDFKDFISSTINCMNYPFSYQSYSSF